MSPRPIIGNECPFCHRPFSAQLISKDKVDTSLEAPKPESGGTIVGRQLTSRYSHGEDSVTYKLTYRCKHCGKEWTKLSEKEVEVPRGYVESEYEQEERAGSREEPFYGEETSSD